MIVATIAVTVSMTVAVADVTAPVAHMILVVTVTDAVVILLVFVVRLVTAIRTVRRSVTGRRADRAEPQDECARDGDRYQSLANDVGALAVHDFPLVSCGTGCADG